MSTVLSSFGVSNVLGASSVKALPTKEPSVKIYSPENIAGIELEIEYSSEFGYPKYFSRHTDGSLRNQGYEFISSPLRIDTLVEQLGSFFDMNARYIGPECYSDRTSTHVHMNVQHFTKENIKTLLLYYALVEPILFNFVGNYRQENIYCVPLNETLLLQDMNKTINQLFSLRAKPWQKYTALNILPITRYGTVEFRHMHGTADMTKLTTWLNTLSNLITVSHTTPLDKCIESIQKIEEDPQSLFTTLLPCFEYNNENKSLFSSSSLYSKYLLVSELKTVKKLPAEAPAVEVRVDNDDQMDAVAHNFNALFRNDIEFRNELARARERNQEYINNRLIPHAYRAAPWPAHLGGADFVAEA
jgi:hypothetical protein